VPSKRPEDAVQAITYFEYGPPDVLQLREVDKPVVKDDEVLIRVRAASANPQDWHYMRGLPYIMRAIATGLFKPKANIIGSDVAGEVEATGSDVTRFQPGDEVFARVEIGAFAEYVSFAESLVGLKPTNLSFEQAAAMPMAGLVALQSLRDVGALQEGQRVLINGASGGIGTFAVQIAKAFDAEVTGVCSTKNVDLVRSIGADHVVDYTLEDFTTGSRRYDLILDTVGNRSLSDYRRVLVPKGTYVTVGGGGGRWFGPAAQMLRTIASSPFVSQRTTTLDSTRNKQDAHFLKDLKDLAEAGKLAPVIDRTYPMQDAREAIRYLETGHTRGKVVVTL
jgi:NADPH:quinone reductase-like Zn-dependent oxidoreductase